MSPVLDKNGYEPIDADSSNIRRNRILKLVGAAIVIGLGVVGFTVTRKNDVHVRVADPDALFAGLLMDDEGFYFPTKATPEASPAPPPPPEAAGSVEPPTPPEGEGPAIRRVLKKARKEEVVVEEKQDDNGAPWAISWSYNWKKDKALGSAVGEYYKAKGMALGDYYRSMYDPTYKGDTPVPDASGGPPAPDAPGGPPPPPSDSVWSYDWQADKERGEALGEKYKEIGKAIDDHYKQMYSTGARRRLATPTSYDWQADRDRGMAIGEQYKALGLAIAEHYSQEYGGVPEPNAAAGPPPPGASSPAPPDWDVLWKEYRAKGQEIADYYREKGLKIAKFYSNQFDDLVDDSAAAAIDEAGDAGGVADDEPEDTDGKAKPPSATEWREKGMAISEFYRAMYDPTYDPDAPDGDEEFPPWGQDPEADRAHGKAIGKFWKKRGKEIGKYWKEHGKETGQYFEDYYRSQFDPTYKPPADLN